MGSYRTFPDFQLPGSFMRWSGNLYRTAVQTASMQNKQILCRTNIKSSLFWLKTEQVRICIGRNKQIFSQSLKSLIRDRGRFLCFKTGDSYKRNWMRRLELWCNQMNIETLSPSWAHSVLRKYKLNCRNTVFPVAST